jgi:hypothetical protein
MGDVHAIFLVTHDEKSDNEINEIGHAYLEKMYENLATLKEGLQCKN